MFGVSIWKNKLIGVKTEQKRRKEAKKTIFPTPCTVMSNSHTARSGKYASKDIESYVRPRGSEKMTARRARWSARSSCQTSLSSIFFSDFQPLDAIRRPRLLRKQFYSTLKRELFFNLWNLSRTSFHSKLFLNFPDFVHTWWLKFEENERVAEFYHCYNLNQVFYSITLTFFLFKFSICLWCLLICCSCVHLWVFLLS